MDTEYAPAAWGQPSVSDITVPSGGTCQIRQLGLDDIIELGLLDQLDVLGVSVQQDVIDPVRRPADHQQRQPTQAEEAASEDAANQRITDDIFADPAKFHTMTDMVDKVTYAVVVRPTLTLPYRDTETGGREKLPYDERNPDLIYTDSVPFEDRMFIFEQCFGGLRRLQQFRDQAGSDVATVAGGAGDAQPSEPAAGPG